MLKHSVIFTRITNSKIIAVLVIAWMLPMLNSCHYYKSSSNISQGVIEYDIAYNNRSGRDFPIQFMPKTMEMKFNKRYISYTIEDRLGLFSISNIFNLLEKNHVTLVKVFNEKYAYMGSKNEVPLLFQSTSRYSIGFTHDTSRLAGILCNVATISDDSTNENFNVSYTSTINIDEPNQNTPYNKINGILLDFKVQLKNLDMQLTARKVNDKTIDNDEFLVPNGYKYISRSKMEKIITSLLP